jgi:hypothetical protein
MISTFEKLRDFIKETITPNSTPETTVDTYGSFNVKFKACDTDFSSSDQFKEYFKNNDFLIKSSSNQDLIETKDLHNFIKSISDVEMNIFAKHLEIPGIQYAIQRLLPMSSKPQIQMEWLNTGMPFIETVIVPWMKDNTINGIFPLVKADLSITFPRSFTLSQVKNITYIFYGIRPVECQLHRMTNEAVTVFYRRIAFDYDYFEVSNNPLTPSTINNIENESNTIEPEPVTMASEATSNAETTLP